MDLIIWTTNALRDRLFGDKIVVSTQFKLHLGVIFVLDAGDVEKNETQSLLLKSFYFCDKGSTWQMY